MIDNKPLDFKKIRAGLAKYFLLIFVFVLVVIIHLHVALPMTYSSIIMYIMSRTSLDLELSLVTITAIYVILTYQIVMQGATERDIAFTERKLEKFYCPLSNLLEYDMKLVKGNNPQLRIFSKPIHVQERNLHRNYNECITHQYLMNENIKSVFKSFFKKVYLVEKTDKIEHIELYNDLKNNVRDDIEILNAELNDLVKSKPHHFKWIIAMLIIIMILFAIN